MEEPEKPAEKLIASVGNLIETYRDLIVLTIVEKVTLAVSLSVIGVASLLFASFMILFGAVGAAWWIGEAMNNMKAGFFIVGGGFLVVVLVLLVSARKGLIQFIQNMVIKKLYEQD